MPIDTSAISGVRSIRDYQQAEEEFNLKKQLAQAQVMKAVKDAEEMNVKQLGENAFLKIGQGLSLTPQEEAAARFLDAKSGGIQFDPSTGQAIKKPSLFDKMPLKTPMASTPEMPVAEYTPTPTNWTPEENITPPAGPYEREYRKNLAAARGNPKLEQSIKTAYAKSTMEPTADEMKAQGFAERMKSSAATVASPKQEAAALNVKERLKAAIPLLGNYIVSGDYQSFSQAQRDFINAQLRRESGAVISPQEFENAEKQYFPTPGDTEATLAQKRANRESAVNSMIASAGASYESKNKKSQAEIAAELPPNLEAELNTMPDVSETTGIVKPNLYKQGEAEFNKKKGKVIDYSEYFK